MKEKISLISIGIIILFFGANISTGSSSYYIPSSGDIIDIDDEYRWNKFGKIGDDSEENLFAIYPVMSNPIHVNLSDLNCDFSELKIISTPDEFSWRDYDGKDWTTHAKYQGNCGSCWLFAAMGALESVVNIGEGCAELDPDLSEQYVLSCLPEAGSCHGGNVERCVFHFIMNTSAVGNHCNGVITEDCFPYQSNFDYIPPCSEKTPNWEDFLIPISHYGESWSDVNRPDLKDAIKSMIFQKGPIMAYFWVSDRFRMWGTLNKDPSDYYPDFNENCPGYVNHGITIVGWKDDPTISNGGYWICKNSWGPNWGYNGFFNIEYDCLNMGAFHAWVDYDPDSVYWAPVADVGGLYFGAVGQEIIFDASNSFADGDITYYSWDFGDETTGTGVSPTHAYSQRGIYPVILTVTDSEDNSATDTTWVGVEEPIDPPNKPTINGPATGTAGTTYEYTFTATDPNGDNVYYYIDWGDVTFEEWIGPYISGETVSASHTWTDQGDYQIRVKAKDIYDIESEWSPPLSISMPKNKAYITPFLNFLQQHPILYQILQRLLKL